MRKKELIIMKESDDNHYDDCKLIGLQLKNRV